MGYKKISVEHQYLCYLSNLDKDVPEKCGCRKRRTLAEARKLVEQGVAEWWVISRKTVIGRETCPICKNGDFKKTCMFCRQTGEVEKKYIIPELSNDIALIVNVGTNTNYPIYKAGVARKTPRVATIEKAHIERAFTKEPGNKRAASEASRIEAYRLIELEDRYSKKDLDERYAERMNYINEYGLSTLQARVQTMKFGVEPIDNAKKWQGRRYDWGKADFVKLGGK